MSRPQDANWIKTAVMWVKFWYEVKKVHLHPSPPRRSFETCAFYPPAAQRWQILARRQKHGARKQIWSSLRHTWEIGLIRSAALCWFGCSHPVACTLSPPPQYHPHPLPTLPRYSDHPLAATVGVSWYFGTQHINRIRPLVTCLLWYL